MAIEFQFDEMSIEWEKKVKIKKKCLTSETNIKSVWGFCYQFNHIFIKKSRELSTSPPPPQKKTKKKQQQTNKTTKILNKPIIKWGSALWNKLSIKSYLIFGFF